MWAAVGSHFQWSGTKSSSSFLRTTWRYFPQHRSAIHCEQGNCLDSEAMMWSASPSGGCSPVKQFWVADAQPLCLHKNLCHSTAELMTVFMYLWGSVKNKQTNKKQRTHTHTPKTNKQHKSNGVSHWLNSLPLQWLTRNCPQPTASISHLTALLSEQHLPSHGAWRPGIGSCLLLYFQWRCQKAQWLGEQSLKRFTGLVRWISTVHGLGEKSPDFCSSHPCRKTPSLMSHSLVYWSFSQYKF